MSSRDSHDIWSGQGERRTVKEFVVYELIDAMLDGRLPMGSRLPPEAEMCARLKVSRVAFREAVKQLEVLGFLRIERGNGTVVTSPEFGCLAPIIAFLGKSGQIGLGDLHQVRFLIEVEAVRQVAAQESPELVARLAAILDEAEEHADEERSHTELDYEFHRQLIDACPNRLLPLLLSPFAAQLRQGRELSYRGPEASQRTIRTHRAILEAVRQRNPAEAGRLMAAHLVATARDLNLDNW